MKNQKFFHHTPVLKKTLLQWFKPEEPCTMVDATLGLGNHAYSFLEAHPNLFLLGIDRDSEALEYAQSKLSPFQGRFKLIHSVFSSLPEILKQENIQGANFILADLGVSSMQLDNPERGFSFSHEAPLDMRMTPKIGKSALDIIAELPSDELADILYHYGEERYSRSLAPKIKAAFNEGRLQTTTDLRKICEARYPGKSKHRISPATRTFQALRIAVNQELLELHELLQSLPGLLTQGGQIAIISFHSLEDRMVKEAFRKYQQEDLLRSLTKKPIRADQEEMSENPRSRSAKLRIAERLES